MLESLNFEFSEFVDVDPEPNCNGLDSRFSFDILGLESDDLFESESILPVVFQCSESCNSPYTQSIHVLSSDHGKNIAAPCDPPVNLTKGIKPKANESVQSKCDNHRKHRPWKFREHNGNITKTRIRLSTFSFDLNTSEVKSSKRFETSLPRKRGAHRMKWKKNEVKKLWEGIAV